jgi:acetolactate synthase-1/2/3 large subunit
MRYSNILLAQSDLIIAVGTRLGLQQTGFNWKEFAPKAKLVQIDTDSAELEKGHPILYLGWTMDALHFLTELMTRHKGSDCVTWLQYCRDVQRQLPVSDPANSTFESFCNPYDFLVELSKALTPDDLVIPCSSGGSFTAFYQAFLNKKGQKIVSDKSLASMGYGLAGAIGAALCMPDRRVIHIEGDGGFAQNLQELATIAVQGLNVKTFLWCNNGYASIRMTQRNYFDGAYLGCDTDSGLGFPDWAKLSNAYGLDSEWLTPKDIHSDHLVEKLSHTRPKVFLVPIHPEQTFYPKISSRIADNGGMESEPLWSISPHLNEPTFSDVTRYL